MKGNVMDKNFEKLMELTKGQALEGVLEDYSYLQNL
jgi:hypothetical protein